MERTKLAKALGVSRSVLYRDIARGCPTHSVAAARRWRRTHIKPQTYLDEEDERPDFSGYSAEWLGALYRALHSHMSPLLTGFMVDAGLTMPQALEGYRVLALALMHALNDLFPGVWQKPPAQTAVFEELHELGDEGWIAKRWVHGPPA